MAVYTYENVNPSYMENTTMQKVFLDGVHKIYRITPNSGYVLHDNARDWEDQDPDTLEWATKLGFTRGTATCGVIYDFTANPREFYAILETDVRADQIFGGGNNNDHKVT